jgi:trehalose-phosphatase
MKIENVIRKHPLQVPNLFHCWPRVAHRLASSRIVALFLDFDGTLAQIEPRPSDVRLDDATRRVLSRLAHSPRFRVWIVTGRRRDDVRARVRVRGIRYLGLHGWEGRSAPPISAATLHALASVKELLRERLASLPEVFLEDKALTVAVHYRGIEEEQAARARSIVQEVLTTFSDSLRMVAGKKVWELTPREMGDKGDAVKSELSAVSSRALAVYIGDDLVDEAAFVALASGITVRVGGPSRTRARYRLASVNQVHRLLAKLSDEFA